MVILLDTSILVRPANVSDPQHPATTRAVLELHRGGNVQHVTPQVLVEFRSVATRPRSANGAGLTPTDAESHAAAFESRFPLLVETPDIFPAWKALVKSLGIIGKQVHDARLVAVCHTHKVTHILTFNTSHFVRMAGFGPGITVLDPAAV